MNEGAKTILVVDDDEAIRELVVHVLSQRGYKVIKAEGPREAMQLAAATPAIHLLLTDFSMPDTNGFELAREFRDVHPTAPILMISGSVQLTDSPAIPLDRFAMLAKPFTLDDLVSSARTLLGDATTRHAVA